MEPSAIQPWSFHVEPYVCESISHFLGRFRRANELTPSGLGKLAGLGGAIGRWEKLRFNPSPTSQQLEALAQVVGVSAERLVEMLPPTGVAMKLEPIRLCAACYVEHPYHRIDWQFKDTRGCDHHQLCLLSECPSCKARFPIPSLWREGKCRRCLTPCSEIVVGQKPIRLRC